MLWSSTTEEINLDLNNKSLGLAFKRHRKLLIIQLDVSTLVSFYIIY